METIQGRRSHHLNLNGFKCRLANYSRFILDLGTGDGRYVRTLAGRHPDQFFVGVDACRENLHEYSRAKLKNMLFVIASAQDLPGEFNELFSQVTINFPWGSLLESLLSGDPCLMRGLLSISRPGAQIEIHLNGGALAETGTSLDAGAERIYGNMNMYGWKLKGPHPMNDLALRGFPTTWAKRLAYGRDPRAIVLHGTLNK
jgi:16S rRNA (adenine(1408)-N(1))-methyltransferase